MSSDRAEALPKTSAATKIALDCLGCKLNQAEIELLARQLTEAGYRVVSSSDSPDVYILNTCTVTHIADRKSRHLLRMAHRQNPGARLVAIGCYATRAARELSRIDGVDLVLGNEPKPDLVQQLEKAGYLSRPASHPCDRRYDGGRARAFIKVQDGCRSFCSYCVVPLVRVNENSVSVDQVLVEVTRAVAAGYNEVVLTGTKVGSYNHNGVSLGGLLKRVLSGTDIARLRLSSLQPQEISPRLIELWHDQRLRPHFHLSLQSGSDAVLHRMKRRYTTGDYREAVSLIRRVLPEAAITTDTIVGFPGETEAEFGESRDFCKQMDFARIHVFPYSPRQGTEAATMPGQIGDRARKERVGRMLALAEESAGRFRQRFLGRKMTVLWEKQVGGIWSGLTGNYIKVHARWSDDLAGRLTPARLVAVDGYGLWGEVERPAP